MASPGTTQPDPGAARNRPSWYSHYVLFVLVIVYIFNFIDRNILSILSQDIQADLGVSDAEMGFLYGTVFAVFYAVFGIPLARFADVWVRRSLISMGLVFWSAMTALSGFARSFPQLALFRIGVGIGEASASPAAYSMLSDYYSPKVRATVLAIYSSGVYIGGGIGLFLGGFIMETWNGTYPIATEAPFGIKGWQAAFLAVGIPGIFMAIWVRTLREPVRGESENLIAPKHPAPWHLLGTEMASMLPVFNLWGLKRAGASLGMNALAALLIVLVAGGLMRITGNIPQWVALGIGIYVTFSWAQSLKHRDPATFGMIFKSKALILITLAFPSISFVTYGIGYWTAPLLLRLHDTSPGEVGMYIGLGSAVGGLLGVTLGGVVADWAKQKHPAGRLIVGFIAIAGTAPLVLWMVYTESLMWAFALNFLHHLFSASWPGIPPSTASDLVMPRMRAIAGAYYILMNTMIGLAMGPYFIGQLSDTYAATGMNSAASLQTAIATGLLIFIPATLLLLAAWRYLPKDEASRLERAKALGEPVEPTSTA
ncbi:MAG: MFS transporter [Pseudomonadales bacterium]|jgi:MFS family permease|tara:strand:- start:6520 stop:8139 length:1620 start_codon:yes stop_codon:yes gene_type:complete